MSVRLRNSNRNDYKLLRLQDAHSCINQRVNIIAIVLEFGLPKTTRGTGNFHHFQFSLAMHNPVNETLPYWAGGTHRKTIRKWHVWGNEKHKKLKKTSSLLLSTRTCDSTRPCKPSSLAMAYIKSCISYSALPFFQRRALPPASYSFPHSSLLLSSNSNSGTGNTTFTSTPKTLTSKFSNNRSFSLPRSTTSSSNSTDDDTSNKTKTPFGYSRKDVILIGFGLTFFGIALKTGLEYVGVDPLQAGNVVQLVLVLGLTIGWISTYIFRVSNKEMTYAQQLRDYESKVMEKRLESLTEAELEVLLQEVEEEKSR